MFSDVPPNAQKRLAEDRWIAKRPEFLQSVWPYVNNRIRQWGGSGVWKYYDCATEALSDLIAHGATIYAQYSMVGRELRILREQLATWDGLRRKPVSLGGTANRIDYVASGISFDSLHVAAVGMGGAVPTSKTLRSALSAPELMGKCECALLNLSPSAVWTGQSFRNRVLNKTRAQQPATKLRPGEFQQAHRCLSKKISHIATTQRDVREATHDVMSPHHDRNFRNFGWFLAPNLQRHAGVCIRVSDISRKVRQEEQVDAIVYEFANGVSSSPWGECIYGLVVRGRHMRFLKPSAGTLPPSRKQRSASAIKVVRYSWNGWWECLHADAPLSPTPTLRPCKWCGQIFQLGDGQTSMVGMEVSGSECAASSSYDEEKCYWWEQHNPWMNATRTAEHRPVISPPATKMEMDDHWRKMDQLPQGVQRFSMPRRRSSLLKDCANVCDGAITWRSMQGLCTRR